MCRGREFWQKMLGSPPGSTIGSKFAVNIEQHLSNLSKTPPVAKQGYRGNRWFQLKRADYWRD